MRLYNTSSSPVTYHGWFQSSLGASPIECNGLSAGITIMSLELPVMPPVAITAAAYTSRWYWKSLDGKTLFMLLMSIAATILLCSAALDRA